MRKRRGIISSPNFYNHMPYPTHSFCRWLIKAPPGEVSYKHFIAVLFYSNQANQKLIRFTYNISNVKENSNIVNKINTQSLDCDCDCDLLIIK